MAGEGRMKGWLQPQRAVGLRNVLALLSAVVSALCGWASAAVLLSGSSSCVPSLVLWGCGCEEQGGWGSD